MADDEAEMYDGARAQFPLSFGKQAKSQTSLELVHNATRRNKTSAAASVTQPADGKLEPSPFPSLSSSSKSWLNSLKNPKSSHDSNSKSKIIGPSRPPAGLSSSNDKEEEEEEDSGIIGPPRPAVDAKTEEDEDGEMIGPPRPPLEEEDGEMIGPPPPPSGSMGSDSEDDMEEEEEQQNQYRIPLSNEIVLKGHTKVVSALTVDHSGSRVLSGSYDYTVRMYDFQGMNARLQSFRQLEPSEGHQVRSLSWSPTADRFLCVTGSAQAKIYDRDGLTLGEFVRGDMYIRDLKNTKGHISGLTCGEWHPKTKETILTSSEDGSLRLWDVNDFKSQKQVCVPQ